MKVLVTGGCGFIGTNLCLYYKKKGWDVFSYDNLAKHEFARMDYMKPAARHHNKDILEQAGINVFVEDIRDKKTLMNYSEGCDFICTYGPDKINSELKEKETRYIRKPVSIDENKPQIIY